MIKINTARIGEEGLDVSGAEPAELLALPADVQPPVAAASDIVYRLRAMMVGQDLLVTGNVQVEISAECARCLEPFKTVVRAPSVCLHYEKIPDQEVEITDDVREELLLAFPAYFHCSENCKGICPGCGANLNHETCKCSKAKKKTPDDEDIDESPWKALDSLK